MPKKEIPECPCCGGREAYSLGRNNYRCKICRKEYHEEVPTKKDR